MGSGAALAAGQTFGLTESTIGRSSDVSVADDPQALLGIDGLSGCDDSQLTFQNNLEETLSVTVSTSALNVTSPTAGKTTTFTLTPDQQQVVEFAPGTNTRDDVTVTASTGSGEQIDLTRTVTVTPVDPAVYQPRIKNSWWLAMGVQNGATAVRLQNRWGRNTDTDWAFVTNDDCTYRIRNEGAGGVLSVQDPTTTGSELIREPWNGNDWQRWTIIPNDDGTVRFRNAFSGQVAHVDAVSQGERLRQRPWDGQSNDDKQSWNTTQTGTVGYTTIDTTSAGNATFDTPNLVINAAGADMWTSVDEYGAIVKEDVQGGVVARTTVVSQNNTGEWAKAGIMFANDADGPGTSIGDVKVNVTPNNGFEMTWDSDGDGYHDDVSSNGTASYPCDLRLRKQNPWWPTFIGEYSTDGGKTWTEVGRVQIPDAERTQDVALINCAFTAGEKSPPGTKSRVEFDDFTVQ